MRLFIKILISEFNNLKNYLSRLNSPSLNPTPLFASSFTLFGVFTLFHYIRLPLSDLYHLSCILNTISSFNFFFLALTCWELNVLGNWFDYRYLFKRFVGVFFVIVNPSWVVLTLDHNVLTDNRSLSPFVVLCNDLWVLVEDYVLLLWFDIKDLLSWLDLFNILFICLKVGLSHLIEFATDFIQSRSHIARHLHHLISLVPTFLLRCEHLHCFEVQSTNAPHKCLFQIVLQPISHRICLGYLLKSFI